MTKHLSSQDYANIPVKNFRPESLASLPSFGNAGRLVYRTSDNTLHVDLGGSWKDITATITSLAWGDITGKPATFTPSAHGHVSTEISDFTSAVNAAVTQYFDDATTDTTRDQLVELINLITTNETAISQLQSKADVYAVTGPASSATTMTVTHNLNTTDVVVQVRDATSNEVVLCDTTITNANVVTLTFAAAQTQNTLRCVVIG